MSKILFVHLSDIHLETLGDNILRKAVSVATAISTSGERHEQIILVVTGDIAYSGKISQYKIAEEFLNTIKESLRNKFAADVNIVVVPGNHDCNFEANGNETRAAILETIRKRKNGTISLEILTACCAVQSEFDSFRKNITTLIPYESDSLWHKYSITVGIHRVLIHGVNTAWSSELGNGLGAHEFPTDQYQKQTSDIADLRVLLMHHPYHWLNNARYREFEKLVRHSAELVFTGHEHTANAGTITDLIAEGSLFVEGGVFQVEPKNDSSTFLTCTVDLINRQTSIRQYEWRGNLYSQIQTQSTTQTLALPHSVVHRFPYSLEWSNNLADLGAAITHHAKVQVSLSDLYVMPEFEVLDDNKEIPLLIKGDTLLEQVEDKELFAIFKGEQSAGKTAWLKIAAKILHEKGKIPILIRGSELANSAELDLQKIIKTAVIKQYGEHSLENILQEPRENKILLIDGLDRYRFPDRYFNTVIQFFKHNYYCIFATSEQMLTVKAAMEHEAMSSLLDFDAYELKEFGIRSRFELIRMWFELAPLTTQEEEDTRRNKIEQADKLITSMIGRGLVPAFPIYLLVLLQGLEAGQSGELENSALGEYYNYLISHALLQNIRREQIKPIYDYCDHFSWFLKQSKKQEVSETELLAFHLSYCAHVEVEVKFEFTKTVLIDSKIWVESENAIGFRYPYARYFFLGRYLAREMIRSELVFEFITAASKNLHVRENGNIITFLAHFSDDPRVINLLVESVGSRFNSSIPLRLDTDVDKINQLVTKAPKLVYDHNLSTNNRHNLVEQEVNTITQFEQVKEDETFNDNEKHAVFLISELNSLFKGAEILGSAIKANSTSMPADEKQRLLSILFNGGLRGVSALLDEFSKDSNSLIGEIESLIQKKKPTNIEERGNIAKQAVFMFVASLTYLFIRRIGVCIGSVGLQPAIDRYVSNNSTVANQLIGIASLLETPKRIPFDKLKKLNQDFKTLALAQFLLRHLSYTRLHMYQTEVKERQQICQELGIEMNSQRAADYQTRNNKRMVMSRNKKKRRKK